MQKNQVVERLSSLLHRVALQTPERPLAIFIGLLIGGAYLFLGFVHTSFVPFPSNDGVHYFGLGQGLAKGAGFCLYFFDRCEGSSNFTLGFPLLLSFPIYLFGDDFQLTQRYIMLFGLGALAFVYLIFLKLMPKQPLLAGVITLLCAFHRPFFLFSTAWGFADAPFLFFVFGGIYFHHGYLSQEKWLTRSGLMGCAMWLGACLIRPAGPPIVLAVALCLLLWGGTQKKLRLNKALFVAGLSILPALLLDYLANPEGGYSFYSRIVEDTLFNPEYVRKGHGRLPFLDRLKFYSLEAPRQFLVTFNELPRFGGLLRFSFWILALLGLCVSWIKGQRYLVVVFVGVLLTPLPFPGISNRYALPFYPFFIYFVGVGFMQLYQWLQCSNRWVDLTLLVALLTFYFSQFFEATLLSGLVWLGVWIFGTKATGERLKSVPVVPVVLLFCIVMHKLEYVRDLYLEEPHYVKRLFTENKKGIGDTYKACRWLRMNSEIDSRIAAANMWCGLVARRDYKMLWESLKVIESIDYFVLPATAHKHITPSLNRAKRHLKAHGGSIVFRQGKTTIYKVTKQPSVDTIGKRPSTPTPKERAE